VIEAVFEFIDPQEIGVPAARDVAKHGTILATNTDQDEVIAFQPRS
jgi:hypothetical protein